MSYFEEKPIDLPSGDVVRFYRPYDGADWRADFIDGIGCGYGVSWREAGKNLARRLREAADELEKKL